MSVDQSGLVPAEGLQQGASLAFDLVDSDGQLLHKTGTKLDDQLLTELQDRHIRAVPVSVVETASVLAGYYPESTVKKTQLSFQKARTSLLRLLASLHENDETKLDPVSASIGEFIVQAKADIAASLAAISLNSARPSPKVLENVATHSANMALLSVAMSVFQKDEPIVSYHIGLAALLHDSSLLVNCDWFGTAPNARDETARKKYRRHPIDSADLFNGVVGIANPVLAFIMEVHEQADGTGYPRGRALANVRPGSEILNVADAYLTLTNPVQGRGMVPPDALGYLCFHTVKGKFSRETLHLLTKCLSMYPIGSAVELDDRSTAVVVRVNSESPLKPIVRLLHPGHLEINLGESNRFISGPYLSGDSRTERLSKSRMNEVLWKTDR